MFSRYKFPRAVQLGKRFIWTRNNFFYIPIFQRKQSFQFPKQKYILLPNFPFRSNTQLTDSNQRVVQFRQVEIVRVPQDGMIASLTTAADQLPVPRNVAQETSFSFLPSFLFFFPSIFQAPINSTRAQVVWPWSYPQQRRQDERGTNSY